MRERLSPGLLNIFRLFVWIRTVFIFISSFRYASWFGDRLIITASLTIAISLFLLSYLYLPQLQKWLGKVYLPLALVMLTLMLVLESRVAQWAIVNTNPSNIPKELEDSIDNIINVAGSVLHIVFTPPEMERDFNNLVNSPFFPLLFTLSNASWLFVPLVLTSWQYNFRSALLFIFLTSALEIGLLVPIRDLNSPEFSLEVFGIITRDGAFLIVGYVVSQLASTQRKQHEDLQASHQQLTLYATTQEKLLISQERNRLARELHDTLAHTMSAVTVKLNATHLLWERDAERAKTMLAEIIASMNEGNVEIRRALRDLRATPLDDMGLVLALQHLTEAAALRGGFTLQLDLPNHELRFAPEIELGIYRIVQEALTNAVEHANAKSVQLCLRENGKELIVSVRDDGLGFQLENEATEGHFGLRGMKERATMLGGSLKIESQIQAGTSIELRLEQMA